MTAARITNGRLRPRTAITKVRAISITGARVPAPVSSLRARNQATKNEAECGHERWQQTAGEQRDDR